MQSGKSSKFLSGLPQSFTLNEYTREKKAIYFIQWPKGKIMRPMSPLPIPLFFPPNKLFLISKLTSLE